jgi:DNA-binding PadR family transcriptional regulator
MRERGRRRSLKARYFHILLSLADEDLHGLQIMEDVSARTQGDLHLWPGMLYGSLKQLADEGLVEETDPPDDAGAGGGRPRYYRITEEGRRALSAEVARLSSYVAVALAKNVT